jgi:hypothetical protein
MRKKIRNEPIIVTVFLSVYRENGQGRCRRREIQREMMMRSVITTQRRRIREKMFLKLKVSTFYATGGQGTSDSAHLNKIIIFRNHGEKGRERERHTEI